MKTKLIIATAMMATTAMAQPKLTPQNIDQVLKEMTLQEKATMLVGYTFGNKLTGYVTGGATVDMGDGPRGKLVRGHLIKNISGDAFTGDDCLAVNCKLVDVDSTGVMDEPAFHRSQGIQGAWTHDVILADITGTECACNGFIGVKLRDSVFSNITLETTGPEKRFVSRYAWEMENVWFDNVKVTGQEWDWFKAKNNNGNFTPTDVRVTGCSFELPKESED